ncbi:MAG TPA: D-alanyl-D-alanine carboxypeptidase family protein [Geminicoccaceae bacterium]|nr:D-alanyl-D-alanine carboxypeptidase family protein [Geminicoccus sp.]HMU49067.1 D-alanyl-D-alanine carboxypeptidase family protein [Geminicoccaceae bacterium]
MNLRRLALLLLPLTCLLARPGLAFETAAKAAIMLDNRTGQVLFAKDADVALPPASMSKLMTAYMVFEQLRQGRLKLDDMLPVSEHAWKMGGSQMFLEVGDRVSVGDLLRGIIIQSGNDACVVVAEALAGSEPAFAEMMNARAAELGLTASHFANSNGLDEPGHLMSVRDLAVLARRIIQDFPEFYSIYSEREYTYGGIKQQNRNPLLQAGVPGVDGMKTGYTSQAGYGLVTSAQRGDQRLILVIAGLPSLKARSAEAARLLEYGFREFQEYAVFKPGQVVREADVWFGEQPKVPLVAADMVAVTLSREARKGMVVKLFYDSPAPAPITRDQPLGRVEVTAPGSEPFSVPLLAAADVPEAGMLGRLTGALNYLIWGRS